MKPTINWIPGRPNKAGKYLMTKQYQDGSIIVESSTFWDLNAAPRYPLILAYSELPDPYNPTD